MKVNFKEFNFIMMKYNRGNNCKMGVFFFEEYLPWTSQLIDLIEDMNVPLTRKNEFGVYQDNITNIKNYSFELIPTYYEDEERKLEFIDDINELIGYLNQNKLEGYFIKEYYGDMEELGIHSLVKLDEYNVREPLNAMKREIRKREGKVNAGTIKNPRSFDFEVNLWN